MGIESVQSLASLNEYLKRSNYTEAEKNTIISIFQKSDITKTGENNANEAGSDGYLDTNEFKTFLSNMLKTDLKFGIGIENWFKTLDENRKAFIKNSSGKQNGDSPEALTESFKLTKADNEYTRIEVEHIKATQDGVEKLKREIVEDYKSLINSAKLQGKSDDAKRLEKELEEFLKEY